VNTRQKILPKAISEDRDAQLRGLRGLSPRAAEVKDRVCSNFYAAQGARRAVSFAARI